jgi:(E)-4-hydroxy-3-methyl-but-2-enyl pyrophosphate reductase
MQLIIAEHAGYCMGVRLAVSKALSVAEKAKSQGLKCVSLGNLINNPLAVESFKNKGLIPVHSVDEAKDAVLVIRSHGVTEEAIRKAKSTARLVKDCTCPFVKRLHESVLSYSLNGKPVIIIGDKNHPEIIGTAGWCRGDTYIISSAQEIDSLPSALDDALVVAQTTFKETAFEEIIKALKKRFPNVKSMNTICSATKKRQQEAKEIASSADCMVVVGSKSSSNTRKLYETCLAYCPESYLVERAAELPSHLLQPDRDIKIGITAGASTPEWLLKEVVDIMNDNERIDQVQNGQPETSETTQQAVVSDPHEQPAVNMTQDEEDKTVQVEQITGESNEADDTSEPTQEAASEPEAVEEAAENGADAPEEPAEEQKDQASKEAKEETPATPKTLLQEAVDNFAKIRHGQEVEGKVVQITDDEVCVNIGYKSDGIMAKSDLIDEDVKIGDTIEVEIVKVNDGEGNVIVSQRNILRRRKWNEIVEKFEKGETVEGHVQRIVKGGLLGNIDGFRTFIPASHVARHFVDDLNPFVGKDVQLKILELDNKKRHIVASRKQQLIEECDKAKEEAWSKLKVGNVVKGIVRRFAKFGAFVDLGGVDGLIHISDLSWVRGVKPEDVLKPNTEIDVLILGLDRERERIQLGLKQLQPKPWDNIEEKYPVGSIITRKVVRICPFGAFVELEPGVDGLTHISQISTQRVENIEDVLSPGQEVNVKILSVDPEAKRISLSIRQALEEQAFEDDNDDIPGLDLTEDELPYESTMATAFKEALSEKGETPEPASEEQEEKPAEDEQPAEEPAEEQPVQEGEPAEESEENN